MENININNSKIIEPPSLIKEFNALGNHPNDIYECIDKNIKNMSERLKIPKEYEGIKGILFDAIDELKKRSKEFNGHYIPNEKTKPVLDFLMKTFVDLEKCNFFGKENFDETLNLIKEKNNVLIIQNHTSPMDALVPLTILKKNYGDLPISIIMSQVFEYARVTNLITSGVEKFPVFQPKHMGRFKNQPSVVNEMARQNILAIRALLNHTKEGGKMIFLYPEKDRNSGGMGKPEPIVMGIPEIISKSSHDLYVLPTFVNGIDSIFPNSPGRNELDDFFDIIKKGQGDFYCGKPIKYTDILKQITLIPEEEKMIMLNKTFSDISFDGNEKLKEKSIISIILLNLIAELAPNDEKRGIYKENILEKVF